MNTFKKFLLTLLTFEWGRVRIRPGGSCLCFLVCFRLLLSCKPTGTGFGHLWGVPSYSTRRAVRQEPRPAGGVFDGTFASVSKGRRAARDTIAVGMFRVFFFFWSLVVRPRTTYRRVCFPDLVAYIHSFPRDVMYVCSLPVVPPCVLSWDRCFSSIVRIVGVYFFCPGGGRVASSFLLWSSPFVVCLYSFA